MKILLVAVTLFVIIEIKAHEEWMTYGPEVGNGRRYYPSQTSSWPYPQQQSQSNGFDSNVEWVCHNPRTHDMMIIASDNTKQTYPGRRPWQWQNIPSGHHTNHHHQHGNDWTGPIIIIEQEQEGNHLPSSTPETNVDNNNNNNNNNNNDGPTQTTTPRYHGGEGMIDIRMGV